MFSSFFTPFRTILFFVSLSVLGWVLFAKVQVDLDPSVEFQTLNIVYDFPDNSPKIVEQDITSLLEGAFSRITELKKIESASSPNGGSIKLHFDQTADLKFKEFEIATVIRQVYPKLPNGASFPIIIRGEEKVAESRPIISYTINAPVPSYEIKLVVEKIFLNALAPLRNIDRVEISGTDNRQLSILYDSKKIAALHINTHQLTKAIQNYFQPLFPGHSTTQNGDQLFIKSNIGNTSLAGIENIIIQSIPGELGLHLVRLKDIAEVRIDEKEPSFYFRVNGNNAVAVNIFGRVGENQISATKRIKSIIQPTQLNLPKNFELLIQYDASITLQEGLSKNLTRMGITFVILLTFILAVYRNFSYVLAIAASILISIGFLSFLLIAFHVNLHIYSLAGMSISFGIIIINILFVIENNKPFHKLPLFQILSTFSLNLIFSLCMILFFPAEEQIGLLDFAYIVVLNSISSLFVAYFFTNNILSLLTSSRHRTIMNSLSSKRKKAKLAVTRVNKTISAFNLLSRWKLPILILLIFLFGLPIFLLPLKWEGDQWYHKLYNTTLGNTRYVKDIKPFTDKLTGGTFRLFLENLSEHGGYREFGETKIYIIANLTLGNTTTQLNQVLASMEEYISQLSGIKNFVTRISGQKGIITISFPQDQMTTGLPSSIKSKLVAKSLDWDGVTWNIYGVGQGFSNAGNLDIPLFRVIMKGYNFDQLGIEAEKFAHQIQYNPRVRDITVNSPLKEEDIANDEYVLELNIPKMAVIGTYKQELLSEISGLSNSHTIGSFEWNSKLYPIVLSERNSTEFSKFRLLNQNLSLSASRKIQVGQISNFYLKKGASVIRKENRQYINVVSFSYLGFREFGARFLDDEIALFRKDIRLGFSLEQENRHHDWNKNYSKYFLLLLLVAMLFLTSAILLENTKIAAIISLTTPLSFIGVFEIFSIGEFFYDQGGFVAFLLLSALATTFSSIISVDILRHAKHHPPRLFNRAIILTLNRRWRVIALATVSILCSLAPFLQEGKTEVVWFPLSIGLVGGLIMSLLVNFLLLPIFLWKKTQ